MSGDRAARRPGWYLAADVALLALALLLTVTTTLIVVVPAIMPAVVNDRLDIAIITSACIIAISGIGPKVAGYFSTLNSQLP